MVAKKLKEFLDARGARYVTISHSPAYTAQEVAASAHISGREMAKTVVVKLDGKLALAVLPASCRLDMNRLKAVSRAREVSLAGEPDFKDAFPGCEVGAMPPFGNLYGMDVYVDEAIAADEEIGFNAGSHTEVIRMKYADYAALAGPKVGRIAEG